MEYRLLAAGKLQHLATPFGVKAAVGVQNAKDDAVGSMLEQGRSVAQHDGKILVGVAEASRARAHHRHYRNANPLLGLDQRAQGRRKSGGRDGRAQLDAISAATFRGHAVFYCGGDDLQQDAGHACTSFVEITIDRGAHRVEYLAGFRAACESGSQRNPLAEQHRVVGWRR